jgi:16S rRNA (guanine527-N7)-methyltransferase
LSPGDAAVADRLAAFEALVQRWNRRSGLVSRADLFRLRERHIDDSLALLPLCRGRLADVGSGGGFPGIPLAIARPAMSVTLFERSLRKSRFLRHAAMELGLDNVEVVLADVADYRPVPPFDTVTVRAVAPPPRAWALVRHLLAVGGTALLQSHAPLADQPFHGGKVRAAESRGEAWVTAVTLDADTAHPEA